EAEPEIPALGARFGLAAAEGLDPANRVERLLQRAGIIAAVVDDRLAVAIRDADPVRHLVGADHVAAAHFGRFETEGARHEVYRTFHREGGFRAAGAAIGRVRHLVGDGDPARGREILDLVRAGQMHRGVVGDAGADRVPGAAIDEIIVADRDDAAVIVEADFDIMQLVARMGRAHQVLTAVLDPAHPPSGSPRPTVNAPIRLVSKRSWTIGLSGRNAASGSTTAVSSSRSQVMSSAASSAWLRLSAAIIAMASPTCLTLSCARSGCCGLR